MEGMWGVFGLVRLLLYMFYIGAKMIFDTFAYAVHKLKTKTNKNRA